MADDDSGKQEQLRREAEEKEKLLAERREQILEVHGETLGQKVAIHEVDEEVSKAAVGLLAKGIAENTLNRQDFDASQIQLDLHVDNRRVSDAVETASQQTDQIEREPVAVTQGGEAQQVDPMQGIETHRPNYAELRETHEQVAAQEAAGTEQRGGTIAQGEPQNDARAYGDEVWQNALDRYEGLSADLQQMAPEAQQQTAADPLQPVEIQDHGATETHTGKVDRVAEFLKAENLDRESRKAALQQLGQAAGREINEQEGKEIGRDFGGGISL
jgi:hypothetical protein